MDILEHAAGPRAARRRISLALLIALATLAGAGCFSVRSNEGGFLMGGHIHIEDGDVAHDEIVMLGGSVQIDGEARSDIVVLGGTLQINGTANDVVCIGGSMRLGPDARIRGDVVNVGGSLSRSPGADIRGELVDVGIAGFDMSWFGGDLSFGRWWGLSPWRVMTRTTQFVYWLLLAVLTVALVGDRVSSAAHSIQREPVRLGAIGIVGFFALLLLTVFFLVLCLLLIGIPFLLALLLGWWLAYIFGMVSVFQVIGDKVSSALGKPDASQVGLVLAGAAVLGILHFFPIIGWLLWTVGAFIGLGAVFATRFGTNRPWVGGSEPPVVPATSGPPAPPMDPVASAPD